MSGSVQIQDWLTLTGVAAATSSVKLLPHRDLWLWIGDAPGAVVMTEIVDLSGGTTKPALVIETAVSEDGPWTAVATYNTVGATVNPLYLKRNPADSGSQHMAGFLRWAVIEGADTTDPDPVAWVLCFRITAILEPGQ